MNMELGQLAQGNDYRITPTDIIYFVSDHDVPTFTKITYVNFFVYYRPLKLEPNRSVIDYRYLKPEFNRIRCVVGEDKTDYMGDTCSSTIKFSEVKPLYDSVILDTNQGDWINVIRLKRSRSYITHYRTPVYEYAMGL